MKHETNRQGAADFLLELGLTATETETIVSGLRPEQIVRVNYQSNEATDKEQGNGS